MVWKPHATVAAIIEREQKFLMIEELVDGERVINQPAGHLDPDESLVEAAVRETLEEAGVFLADRNNMSTTDLERINSLRLAADLKRDWLVNLIENEQWCLTLSALYSWSHWITPVLMKRRFDTRFFIAEMPAGQSCRPDLRADFLPHGCSGTRRGRGALSGQRDLSRLLPSFKGSGGCRTTAAPHPQYTGG